MKIEELEIKGFRSLCDVKWKPGDLNVIIGPNASGKSNLLKALELLAMSAIGKLGDYIQKEGGMIPLLWDGRRRPGTISMRIKELGQDIGDKKYVGFIYQLLIGLLGENDYKIEKESFNCSRRGGSPISFKRIPNDIVTKGANKEVMALGVFEDDYSGDFNWNETVLSQAMALRESVISSYKRELVGWRIYHDVYFHRDSVVRQPNIARRETALSSDGQNLISFLHTHYTEDREFKREINNAMKSAFGNDFEELVFPPAADQRIQLRIRWGSLQREISAADLSDGTLRFLFLLAIFINPKPPSLVAIDEPETGLHPSMMKIVAEYAVEASRKSQIILTTHSAEFLNSFTETIPTTTIMSWEEGKTKLRIVNENDLKYWLKDYTLGNMFTSGELDSLE